jgi:asparagine synthase (glutamine-hydrolysing)
MCGIYASFRSDESIEEETNRFNTLKHRGPDNSQFLEINHGGVEYCTNNPVRMGFHRLSIIDVNERSNQPIEIKGVYLVCNGEIFNYKILIDHFGFQMKTKSDCEVILHLYLKFGHNCEGVEKMCKLLNGEFAFVIYDSKNDRMVAARDPFGIRPLFNIMNGKSTYFASELKALKNIKGIKATQFQPGHYYYSSYRWANMKKYHDINSLGNGRLSSLNSSILRSLIEDAVKIRLMSDQSIGCFLSGGLDSSIVVSIVSEYLPNLTCFSIGLEGSVDIEAAKKVVEWLNKKGRNITHHIKYMTIEEGFVSIPDVICHLESYDITTIRAGIPNYLLAKYVKEKTDIRVLYSGSGSDELFNGYSYGKKIKTPDVLVEDSQRLLSELYMFDNLRDDRTTAAFGLEIRVPFLDKNLIDYVFSVSPEHRYSYNTEMEKMMLRDAVKDLLPQEILYRRKSAFSDAVSSTSVSWYQSVAKLIEQKINDKEFIEKSSKFNNNPNTIPPTKEALYYRQIFNNYYPDHDWVINRFWLPPSDIYGSKVIDPSATLLSTYIE